ncbi:MULTISPECIES: hypothetical protein [unclassified Crossiella]|uniref:hypothetical protein n=1 Tax=unclassified Crossiella TaxID=2620835 RepID=UPI001FFFC9FD|nr:MULTISPECIES: hypothetical protein [unclassified Crossiella]MCK2239941.1 hypothetical protein [Crossiella sp. S99.2]MCK2252649.1 hypothetical protein [Crossiella sp. S99.1]
MSTESQAATGVAVSTPEPAPTAPAETTVETAPVTAKAQAAGTVPPVVEGGAAVSGSTPGKVSKPVIVAAAVAGAVLVALPLSFSGLLEDNGPSVGPTPTGYAQAGQPGNGFVPGVADPTVDNVTGSTLAQPPPPPPGPPATGQPGQPEQKSGESANPGTPAAPGNPPAGNPPPPPPAPPGQQPHKAQAATYEGMAGPGCGGSTRFSGVGLYRDGKAGWVDQGNGGCGTSYVSVPMSGDPNKDDSSAYGLWTFNTGPVTTGNCTVFVFVPNGNTTQVGGSPTSYRVFDRFEIGKGSPIGNFQVNQVAQRGKWVQVGQFRVNGAKLAVQLLTRGKDWDGSGKTYAHHAAAMVKAQCQA